MARYQPVTVLYILISTDPFGGATKSFLALLKGVIQAGIKPVVVVPDTNGIYDTLADMEVRIIVQYEKGCTWTGAKNLRQTLLFIPRQVGRLLVNFIACRSLDKKLRGINIDLVHSNNSVASLGRYIAQKRDIPHLYHIREYGDKDFGLRYFPTNTSFHSHLREKGTYSACITKDIQRHHGLTGQPTSRVIYNGIISEDIELSLIHTTRNFFLYAGRIEPAKGLLKLLMAYCRYMHRVSSPLPLKVAGEVCDSAYMQSVEQYLKDNKIEQHVIFLGKVTNMAELYKTARAIVIPSEYEGFGRCMPEAMSYGCLAVAHDTGGSKEQLDNGRTQTGQEIGFRYRSIDELQERLFTLHYMKDSETDNIRQRAQSCVRELYSTKAYVHSVLSFYTYITNKKQ